MTGRVYLPRCLPSRARHDDGRVEPTVKQREGGEKIERILFADGPTGLRLVCRRVAAASAATSVPVTDGWSPATRRTCPVYSRGEACARATFNPR
jgi:hypothetical protein